MTKDFWIGFLSCACLGMILGLSPIYVENNEMANVYDFIQKPTFKVETSTPNLGAVRVGQPVWVNTNGTLWLYTKIGNTFKKVHLN